MSNVTKKDLIDVVVSRLKGVRRTVVKNVIQKFLDAIIEELAKGHRIELRDFCVLEVKERAARMAQNPKTLEKVEVPPKRSVKFKPGRLMRARVTDTSAAASRPSRMAPTGNHNVHVDPKTSAVVRTISKSQSQAAGRSQ